MILKINVVYNVIKISQNLKVDVVVMELILMKLLINVLYHLLIVKIMMIILKNVYNVKMVIILLMAYVVLKVKYLLMDLLVLI